MNDLYHFLIARHAPSTVNRYLRDIHIYLNETQSPHTAGYIQIMEYIGKLRVKYSNPTTIKTTLQGIKKYYAWLIHTGIRSDHPCKSINLIDSPTKPTQVQDLFSSEELNLLLDRPNRYAILKVKNQVLISFLIYQGLTTGEIIRLNLSDINLEEGTVYIQSSNRLNARTLALRARQIIPLYQYLNEIRPKLLKYTTSKLFINKAGNPETAEQISYLTGTYKHIFPERNLNPKTIRMSVIANLLKRGHDLRLVQAFAGHKNPSSTEQYKQDKIELLQQMVEKYHPLQHFDLIEIDV